MPRSTRPRKQHKPRMAGRPVLRDMHRELILPAYLSIEALRSSNDPEAGDAAYHQMATVMMYMAVALQDKDSETREPIETGKHALLAVSERQERTGVWRCTGTELPALREALAVCDAELPYLRTNRLTEALLTVDAAVARMEA